MDSGSDGKLKRRRGRPPGGKTRKHEQRDGVGEPLAQDRIQDTPSTQPTSFSTIRQKSGIQANPFTAFLQSILRQDRAEIERVARELDVAENTVYRWMNGISVPRPVYLKKLPELFPEHRIHLLNLIKDSFGDISSDITSNLYEVQKELYVKVLELAANSQDEETRMWQVSQAIFDYALLHVDTEHLGMVVAYARLMQQHADGVHSLYEVSRRSNDPLLTPIDATAFLGSTSLAGAAAVMQRLQVWHDTDSGRSLFEKDDFVRSSCAAPVLRNSLLSGVLIFSSPHPDFFKNPLVCQAVTEFALLMAVAVSDREFQPSSLLNLRPMPDLTWQRRQIADMYLNRVILYAGKHTIARRAAELQVQHEIELEFEAEACRIPEPYPKEVEKV
jgi:transcriptional regulator with XRE-family HTH domain